MEQIEISDARKRLDVKNSCIDESSFVRGKLNRLHFEDVDMTGTKITDANLSDLEIENAQLGGAWFHNIGMPPEGHPFYKPGVKQRPLKFDDCNLENTEISNCNLSGVELKDCKIDGMKINGIRVEDLLKAYRSA